MLLDCRTEMMRGWQPEWPALELEPQSLQDGGGLDKDATYVTFCPHGVRSVLVANKLREAGIRAFSFEGGEGPLRSYLKGVARK